MKTQILLYFIVISLGLGVKTSQANPFPTKGNASNIATLNSLTISTGNTLVNNPSGSLTYTTSVNPATTAVTLTPTATDAASTITVNGAVTATGAASQSVTLNGIGSTTTISVTVTSQDGTVSNTFSVIVSRNGSNTASLNSIKLSTGNMLVSVPNTLNYTTSVSSAVTALSVTSIATDGNSTITVNGVTTPSNTASQSIALSSNPTTINIVVTAQDGTTTNTYSITVNKNGSNIASLNSLTLSSGNTLVSVPNTLNYTTSVDPALTSLTVTPTATDPNSIITVNGGSPVTSGTPSQSIALSSSSTTTINILVTAQDGSTANTYSITVSPTGSNIASLYSLTVSTGNTLVPVAGTLNYTTSVNPLTTSLTITPTATDPNSTITVNGITTASNTASASIALNSTGTTTITINVKAQDNTTTNSYSIKVSKTGSNTASLKSLSVSTGNTLVKVPNTLNYTTSVSGTTTALTVTPVATDPTSKITINGSLITSGTASQSITLNSSGTTTINILVTAQDGVTTNTYSIIVSNTGSNIATLSSLSISSGTTLVPVAGTLNYTTSVSSTTTAVTITPTATDPNSVITVNGTIVPTGTASQSVALSTSSPTNITILVTAQDGTTTNTYSIAVSTGGSNIATLSALSVTGATLAFQPTTNGYSISVSPGTTTVTVTPTATDVNAVITIGGIVITSGTSQTITLGSTPIQILVTAQDNRTTDTYTITVGANLYTWTGLGTDSNWNTPANWSPSTNYPQAGDDVRIGTASTGPTVNASSICSTLEITGAATLTLSAPLVVSNGITLNASLTTTGSSSLTTGGLTVNSTSSLTNSGTITVNGNILLAASTSINNITGGTFYAGTPGNVCTINLNNNGTSIQNSGSFYLGSASVINLTGAGASVVNTGTFILQSDIHGSATISAIATTSGGCTGSYNVERFVSGGAGYRGYRLLSSPVYAATVSSNNVYSINYLQNSCFLTGTGGIPGGFDKYGNPTLYLFRENLASSNASFTSGNFRGINTINNAPTYTMDVDGGPFNIPVGNGYLFFFRGDKTQANLATETTPSYVPTNTTLTATGTLNQGQITVHNWYTPASANLGFTSTTGSSVTGFNLVGNPYPSSIDWDKYSVSDPTSGIYGPGLDGFVYILNPTSGGNYNVYQAGFSGAGTYSSYSNIIPSGQGFFVTASSSSAQLTFNESAKTDTQVSNVNTNLFLGTPPQTAVMQYLHLMLKRDTTNADGILINFKSNANVAYVKGEDAPYKAGYGPASLSSISSDGIGLAINTLALPKLKAQSIPLNVNASSTGIYHINLTAIKSIPNLYDVWLMDAYKKDSLDIKHNPTYAFNINKSDASSYGSKRFKLVIRQNAALGVHLLDFAATKATIGAQIVWKTENEENYTNFTVERSTDGGAAFDVIGGVASSAQGTYSMVDKNPLLTAANLYRLKLVDLNGTVSYSHVVTVMYGNLTNTIAGNIKVYPNPSNGPINLSITSNNSLSTFHPGSTSIPVTPNTSSISYGIKIIDVNGSVIKTATSTSANWQADVANLTPGTYIIQVLNNSDKSLVGKSTFIKL